MVGAEAIANPLLIQITAAERRKTGNIFDSCFPDKFKIDYAIVVSIIVTRFCNQAPWDLSVRSRKLRCELFGQFTQLQDAHSNGVLINMQRKERFFAVPNKRDRRNCDWAFES